MKYPKTVRGLFIALLVDALIFLLAVGPGLFFGYVGSEAYEWTSLGIAIISAVVGGILLLGLLFVFYRVKTHLHVEHYPMDKGASGGDRDERHKAEPK